MKKRTSQRSLGYLDANVKIPERSFSERVIEASAGQENLSKKRKIECDDFENPKKRGLIKRNFHTSTPISKELEPCPSVIFRTEQWALTPTYLEEIIETELKLEERIKLSPNFCSNSQLLITASLREILIEWLVNVQIYLKVGNEVLHLSVTIMDQVLDSQLIELDDLQALAAASLWLSFKFHNGGIKANSILQFCKTVTPDKLVQYERDVLKTVGLNLAYPNVMTILHWHLYHVFGKEIPLKEYHACNYLLEIMLLHVDFAAETTIMRSTVAVYTALRLFKAKKELEQRALMKPGGKLIHKRLISTLRLVRDNAKFRTKSSLFYKYSLSRYSRISTHPAMDPDHLPS